MVKLLAFHLTVLLSALALMPSVQAQAGCDAPAAWTSPQSVPPPDHSIAPSSNCAFHVWAWQTFIWMTQPGSDGRPRFLDFPTVTQTFSRDSSTPATFVRSATPQIMRLAPRSTKSSDPFGSVVQAGALGILIHRDGRSVYYSVNVDPVYYQFIRSNRYYDPAVLEAAAPTTSFPVGALEFKYSWRIVGAGEDTSSFFTMPVDIQLLVEHDGAVVVDPARTERATVALVGVHVVGIVKDHPEFIWATFEHQDNAPDLPAGMALDSPDPVSNRNWTFYAANTPAAASNLANADAVKLTDAVKQTLTPVSHLFRQYPWGSPPAASENAENIVALNASVRSRVLTSSVWQKYMLIGGTWLPPNALEPNQSLQTRAVASTRLSNTTMESFNQDESNCFACHNTRRASKAGVTLKAMNLNLSHALTDAYFHAQKSINAARFR